MPEVAFNDGRRLQGDAVTILALGPGALTKLGLPEECVKGFPAAYLDGMATRARILGDVDGNAVSNWSWGKETPDVVLLIYGNSVRAPSQVWSGASKNREPLTTLTSSIALRSRRCRITRRSRSASSMECHNPSSAARTRACESTILSIWSRRASSSLGIPTTAEAYPQVPRSHRRSILIVACPLEWRTQDFATNIVNAPREVGRNGSFLVIRQLAQDIRAFEAYCRGGSGEARGSAQLPLSHRQGIHRREAGRTMERWFIARPSSL